MPSQREKMRIPDSTRETMDILVHETCYKTQLPESVVRELFRSGWKYHEANSQIMWIKA